MKVYRLLIASLLLFTAASAIFGGYHLVTEPSGGSLHMSIDLLSRSPFDDFFYPGLVLLVANGIFSLLTLFLFLRGKNGVGFYVMLQGSILLGWILSEVAMVREYHFLQTLYGFIGVALIFLGLRWRSIEETDPI